MTNLDLHRGISVPAREAEHVSERIRTHGFNGTEGSQWAFRFPLIGAVRSIGIEEKLADPIRISGLLTDTEQCAVCACGTATSGAWYAHRETKSFEKTPLLIKFHAPIDSVYCDPRDFLCTSFQLWDQRTREMKEQQAGALIRLFGKSILPYFIAATETTSQQVRIALCRLAAVDRDVVSCHYENKSVINGRYGVNFASAFFVACPVRGSEVLEIAMPSKPLLTASISLEGFLNGNCGV